MGNRGLAQLVGHVDGFADRHHRGRIGRTNLADRGAAGVDANGDFHFAIPLSAKSIVKVGNCALDRAGRLQGLLGGLRCVAFEAEQRADAIELDVAERAVRRADRVSERFDVERDHIQEVLRQVVAGKLGAV